MFSISKSGRSDTAHRGLPEFSNSLIDGAHVRAISQSRDRCRALGLRDSDRPDFTPLSKADFSISRERSMRLFRHAAPIMEILYEQIINTHSMVLLTDDQGTVLHGIGDNDFLNKAEKVALLPGVNWAENKRGTNGMGTALIDERPTLVHAGEHYLSANHGLTCSAAPIFDPRGDLLGVLDVTSDHRSYHQHTMGLVKMSARMIENDWFNDNFRESLRLYLHPRAEYLGTLMQGILAVSRDGRILGANRCAVEMLGMSPATLRMQSITSLLGTSLGVIVDHARQSNSAHLEPLELATINGLVMQTRAELSWAPMNAIAAGSSIYDDAKLSPAPCATATDSAPHAPVAEVTQPQLAEAPLAPELKTSKPSPLSAGRVGDEALTLTALNTGDPQLSSLIDKTRRILNRQIPLLILGETGSGKEWLARAFHADSQRHDMPFVVLNCASIPDTLIESELFGYEEGAFSGTRRKVSMGKLLQANGGTLFLDEIGDMSLALQTHLLRVLQQRQVTPLGGSSPVDIDIAIVCATHRDLRSMLEKHSFREDLYYRLNGLAIRLPALRQRSDLSTLIGSMLTQLSEQASAPLRRRLAVSAEVMQLFEGYGWPGNLRQLANVLRAAAVMACEGGVIEVHHLPDDFVEDARLTTASMASALNISAAHAEEARPKTTQTLEELEIATIRAALDAAHGNISIASKKLGISRNTIYRKLKWNTGNTAR